jgi:flagellar assembly factor FliW
MMVQATTDKAANPESGPAATRQGSVYATSRFGEIEVPAEKIITLISPLPGFPYSTAYTLRLHSENSPLMWLQSLEEPELAFVVVPPAVIRADYQPELPAAARQEIGDEAGDRLELLVILTIPHGRPQEMTANLLGPLVVNITRRLARQVVLDPTRFDPRWPITG